MSFLLDSNIFIRCKNEMPMDIFHGFWQRLAELAHLFFLNSGEKMRHRPSAC